MEPMDNSVLDQTPVQSYSTAPSNPKKSGKKIWIIVALLAIAIVAFIFLRPTKTNTNESTTIVVPTETSTEPTGTADVDAVSTPEPTAVEEQSEDKEEEKSGPKIQVQNGSGEEGVAGKMKTALGDLGYDSVETSNADNFDYKNVTIKAKDSVSAEATKIKSLLKDYTVEEEVATLSDDSAYDIIVVVGK